MESDFVGQLILPILKAMGWGFYLLPRRLGILAGKGLGRILRMLDLRGKVIRQNLAYAFPDAPEVQEKIVRETYSHLGNLALEILMVFGPMKNFITRHTTLTGAENWAKAIQKGKGAILLSSHVGNWEIMAASSSTVSGMDLMLVTKHNKPEWLHRAIERGRLRYNVRGTYEPRTMRDVLKHLKENKTVGFVLDQYAGPPVGVRVPVFGIPVGTTSAVATLVKRNSVPVLPVVNYRLPDGRYRVEIQPELEWVEGEATWEVGANTARYAAHLERDIFSHPEQWLWSHRRFKGDLTPLRENEWSEGRVRR